MPTAAFELLLSDLLVLTDSRFSFIGEHCTIRNGLPASMGVTIYPDDPSVPNLLLRQAGQAMYAVKEVGRNQYRVFDLDKHLYQVEQWAMAAQLTKALDECQLEL